MLCSLHCCHDYIGSTPSDRHRTQGWSEGYWQRTQPTCLAVDRGETEAGIAEYSQIGVVSEVNVVWCNG